MTKKRCDFPECKKVIGLASYPCKCENHYCPAHRAEHGCTFDYKKEQSDKLLRYMSTAVVGEKVLRI
jgi:hypothetical protein